MRRYSCAWCTAEQLDLLPPSACTVCGEQGAFLFSDVSPPSFLRDLGHTVLKLVLARH